MQTLRTSTDKYKLDKKEWCTKAWNDKISFKIFSPIPFVFLFFSSVSFLPFLFLHCLKSMHRIKMTANIIAKIIRKRQAESKTFAHHCKFPKISVDYTQRPLKITSQSRSERRIQSKYCKSTAT